jgi:hypothetical protein
MAEAVRWRNIAVAGWTGVEEGSLGDEREFGVLRFGRGLKPLRPVIASDWLQFVRQWAAGNADDSASDWLMSRGSGRDQKCTDRIGKGRA